MNHIFIDYENLKKVDPAVFGIEEATFTLLLGPENKSLRMISLENPTSFAATIELVRIASPGKDAVDFTLAYYLGRKVLSDPKAHFHVVSEDTGYKRMIEHLESQNVHVQRHTGFDKLLAALGSAKLTLTPATVIPNKSAFSAKRAETELFERVLNNIRQHRKNWPKKKEKLVSHLGAQFLNGKSNAKIEGFIAKLEKGGHLRTDAKGAITYQPQAR